MSEPDPDVRELPTELGLPRLQLDAAMLREAFEDTPPQQLPPPLRNPHRETPVDEARRAQATPAGVLIPILHGGEGPLELLLTRRHAAISFGGHVCFPGGRVDPEDRGAHHTALREAHEEVGLAPERVEVLGRLGQYLTQSGFRIDPIVALVARPVSLQPREGEVEELLMLPLDIALQESAYSLVQTPRTAPRAHYVLRQDDFHVTGPTISLLIGLYEHLARRA